MMGELRGDNQQEQEEIDGLVREQIIFDYICDWFEFLDDFVKTGKKDQCLRACVQFNTDFARGCKRRYAHLSMDEIFTLMTEARDIIKSADEQQQETLRATG